MTVNQEQIASFREACKPLQEWLIANVHPNCSVMLDSHQAELVECICAINSNRTKEATVKFPKSTRAAYPDTKDASMHAPDAGVGC